MHMNKNYLSFKNYPRRNLVEKLLSYCNSSWQIKRKLHGNLRELLRKSANPMQIHLSASAAVWPAEITIMFICMTYLWLLDWNLPQKVSVLLRNWCCGIFVSLLNLQFGLSRGNADCEAMPCLLSFLKVHLSQELWLTQRFEQNLTLALAWKSI